MFKRRGTIIAEGLKIKGSVSAQGLVEVNGQIEGDVHCTSLFVSPKTVINGGVEADRIVVNGRVEGPIRAGDVMLKSHAYSVPASFHRTWCPFRWALNMLGPKQCAESAAEA
jgi:cytoskeletal protein CcmA (bactofilin family)